MGLDMYLTAEKFLWHDDPLKNKISELVGVPFETKEVRVRAAYWRKANQIHAWFVKNVQNGEDECNAFDVSREQLAALRDACKLVAADPSRAPEILPTQSGFFFGQTEYSDYYMEDIASTIKQLDAALALPDCWSFEYWSSW